MTVLTVAIESLHMCRTLDEGSSPRQCVVPAPPAIPSAVTVQSICNEKGVWLIYRIIDFTVEKWIRLLELVYTGVLQA